jgi:hypothetical protein
MKERLHYIHPRGLGYAEMMTGKRFAPNKLDMASGTLVMLVGYDEDSVWPMVEWTDGDGGIRVTTIDPVIFAEYFEPIVDTHEPGTCRGNGECTC